MRILQFNQKILTKQNFLDNLAVLHKDKLFILGLLIRILLIFLSDPFLHNYFIPFIQSSIDKFSFDPWTYFLSKGGDINAFPYGPIMLLAYLPLSFLGNLIDKNILDLNLLEIGFKFSSLLFDYILLLILFTLLRNESRKLLIFCYWLSPILIYINYINGQLDILPLTLLMSCIISIIFQKYGVAGFLIAAAISSKLSMIIALPFVLIYIQKRVGFQKELTNFLLIFSLSSVLFTLIFLFSKGFLIMVVGSKEFARFYSFKVMYSDELNLYILPIIYFLSLYLIWRLKRINQDLFIIGTGLGFFAILIFSPPAPSWSIWIIPFLAYYQVKSKKDLLSISLIYNFLVVSNLIVFATGTNFYFFQKYILFDYNFLKNSNPFFKDLLFTAQQGIISLLAFRVYIYGLRRNNFFYSLSTKGLIFSINGNEEFYINSFIKSLEDLINKRNLTSINLSNFIFEKKYNFQKIRGNELKKETNIFEYNDDYLSRGLNNLNKLIENNSKDYLLINNDLNFKNINLNRKINLLININKLKNVNNEYDNKFFLSDISSREKFALNFDYQIINKEELKNKQKFSLTTYFPLGFLHTELLRLLITISSLHVESDVSEDKNWVKMTIEGNPSSDDIIMIANNLIKDIDDYPIKKELLSGGYQGIMQIILLSRISSFLKTKSLGNQY